MYRFEYFNGHIKNLLILGKKYLLDRSATVNREREYAMKKKIIIIVLVLLGGLAVWVLKTARDAGEFKPLVTHSDCTCVRVNHVPGAEDIAIDNSTGTAFISSSDRREHAKGNMRQGAIYAYSLEGAPVLRNLTPDLKFSFFPHGISFYAAPDGKKYLFVINHRVLKNCVERFEFRNNMLLHQETIEGGLMISPNDVAAVGPRQFYFTNDHASTSPFFRLFEDYLQTSRSTVVYYDGKGMRTVAGGFAYANGIWAQGKLLYVSSTIGQKFHVFNRAADGSLVPVSETAIGTSGDNIDIDVNGVIRLAAHPKLLTFTRHASDEKKKSPSQILVVARDAGGGCTFTEAYLNTGGEISGASVAAAYKKRLLMGSVFEDFFLDCTMK